MLQQQLNQCGHIWNARKSVNKSYDCRCSVVAVASIDENSNLNGEKSDRNRGKTARTNQYPLNQELLALADREFQDDNMSCLISKFWTMLMQTNRVNYWVYLMENAGSCRQ